MTSAAPQDRSGGPSREEAAALAGMVALVAITSAWWALAFWPVGEAPTWLARTRWVCFGVSSSGLPDAGGWVGLIGGPVGMASILLVGWGRGVRGVLERARTRPLLRATLALLVLGSLTVLGGAALRVRTAIAAPPVDAGSALPPSTYPRLDQDAPDLELVTHDGAAFSLEALSGRTVFVTFAFAHCETVCPTIVRRTLDARDELARGGRDVAVVVVTLDPWRDTPSRLAAMARAWALPENAWVVGGSVEQVEAALDAWQVPRSRDPATGQIAHPSLVYIVGPDGRIAYASNGHTATLVELAGRI